MINLLLATFGGRWRRLDGEGGQFKGFHLMPLLWILPTAWFNPMLGLALGIAWLSLLDGFHGWTDFGYMSKRYAFYSLAACHFAGISDWYILCGLIAGLAYPIGAWIVKNTKYKFEYTEYCEYLAGALMFGGVIGL